jgi:hypothetical protein
MTSPSAGRWHASVEVKSDQDLEEPGAASRLLDAIDEIEACKSISHGTNGWSAFDFVIDADDAMDALVVALDHVRSIWEEWTTVPLPALLDVRTTVTTEKRWYDAIDPNGAIRAWADAEAQPVPPTTEHTKGNHDDH